MAGIVVGLVALVQVHVPVPEMFRWDKPAGLRAFGQSKEAAATSRALAANQGLCKGLLAALLIAGVTGIGKLMPPPAATR